MQKARSLFLCVSFSVFPLAAMAQGLDRDTIALVRETADSICGEIMRDGSNRGVEIEGEVNAELKGLAKRLADAGIEGSMRLEDGRYANVLREELPDELKSARDCRIQVFNKLLDRIGPAEQPAAPVPDQSWDNTGPEYFELAGTVMWGAYINCSVYNDAQDDAQVASINYMLQGMYGTQPISFPCTYNCGIMANNAVVFSGPANNGAVMSGSCSVTAMY